MEVLVALLFAGAVSASNQQVDTAQTTNLQVQGFAPRASTHCTNVSRWLLDLHPGTDFTKLEPFGGPQPRSRIIEWSCRLGLKDSQGYQLPDQVEVQRDTECDFWGPRIWDAAGPLGVKRVMADNVGGSQDFFGLISASSSLLATKNYTATFHARFQLATIRCKVISVDLLPPFLMTLHPDLVQSLKYDVPATDGSSRNCAKFDETSVSKYESIFQYFGTGLFSSATLGGQAFSALGSTDRNSSASDEAGASLMTVVAAHEQTRLWPKWLNGSAPNVSRAYRNSIVLNQTSTIGGTCQAFTGGCSMWTWRDTLWTHPAILDVRLINLSTIVTQAYHHNHSNCGAEIAKAEENYYVRSYLNNFVQDSINSYVGFLDHYDFECDDSDRATCARTASLAAIDVLQAKLTKWKASPITPLVNAAIATNELASIFAGMPPLPTGSGRSASHQSRSSSGERSSSADGTGSKTEDSVLLPGSIIGVACVVLLVSVVLMYYRRRSYRRPRGGEPSQPTQKKEDENTKLLLNQIHDLKNKYVHERAKNEASMGISIPEQPIEYDPTVMSGGSDIQEGGRSDGSPPTTTATSSSVTGPPTEGVPDDGIMDPPPLATRTMRNFHN